jgi:hypothetical protein
MMTCQALILEKFRRSLPVLVLSTNCLVCGKSVMFVLPYLEEITLDNFGVSGFLFGGTPSIQIFFM